jgi:ATP-dependent DNA ligase
MAKAATADDFHNAARGPAAVRQSLRIAARSQPVYWVRPELVAEVRYLTWTDDNLLRQVVYEGLREDKRAAEVRRAVPKPNQ